MKQDTTAKLIPLVVLAVMLGAGGFVGGMQYQKAQGSNSNATMSQMGQNAPGSPGAMNGGMGTVTAISSDSISLKDARANTTKTYTISANTTVTDNGSSASVSDITTGDTVMVQTGSSSSTSATAIMLNPTMGGPNGQVNSNSTNI